MGVIRIVAGVGVGPTGQAAFDAALANAGVERYNLVQFSSVIPTDATLEPVSEYPPLGSTGDRLPVVLARVSSDGDTPGAAGLGWARIEGGPGVFHEASATGDGAHAAVEEALTRGLEHAVKLRSWNTSVVDRRVVAVDPHDHSVGCGAVLAVFGSPRPPWES